MEEKLALAVTELEWPLLVLVSDSSKLFPLQSLSCSRTLIEQVACTRPSSSYSLVEQDKHLDSQTKSEKSQEETIRTLTDFGSGEISCQENYAVYVLSFSVCVSV